MMNTLKTGLDSMKQVRLVVACNLRCLAALMCAGFGRWLFLLLDPADAVAAALGTHSLEVGIEQTAPFIPTTKTSEGDLFRHGSYFP